MTGGTGSYSAYIYCESGIPSVKIGGNFAGGSGQLLRLYRERLW